MPRAVRLVLLLAAAQISACHYFPDHHLVHPHQRPGGVITWSERVAVGSLLIHLKGARPRGPGPFPTVLVHPEGGKRAGHMSGILWDLAARGYCAVAADYQRFIDGRYRWTLFAWRSAADVTAVLDLLAAYPEIDQTRIGALGFSQGGVYSLLLAELAPDRIRAVVSYYPVTDFPRWLQQEQSNPPRRFVFSVIRWYFRRESGATSEEQFQAMLRAASPYYDADAIRAPVLLIHGERDTTAPVDESQRMAERLTSLGKPVQLMVVRDAVHIFNFRQRPQAAAAWDATVKWFDTYLKPF